MSVSAEQAVIIKSTIPVLVEHGATITGCFYKNMLAEVPELHSVFNQTNQVNGHQAQALAGALCAYATYIDDLGALTSAVERISQKHASLFVKAEHYGTVGKYLLEAMAEVLGAALTPLILDAWAAAYWQLANIMIAREAQLYKESNGWTTWRDFTISRKEKESDEITSFYLVPADGKPLPLFKPGQYISTQTFVPALGYIQPRQYSLSEAPRSDYYRISVKAERDLDMENPDSAYHPGYISNILHNTKNVGDTLQVSHPDGEFFFTPSKDPVPVVLLSAGVGMTPLMSILNSLVAASSTQPITWIHGTRGSSVLAFAPHIRALAASHPNIKVRQFNKAPVDTDVHGHHYHHVGRMDLRKLDAKEELFLDHPRAEYYICGPAGFMAERRKELEGLGVAAERIRLELFGTGGVA